MKDPTTRFSGRVDAYVQSRPGYPFSVIQFLTDNCALTNETIVADVGSGTGIFSRLLLENGNKVFAVEPNPEMRAAAERALGGYEGFVSVGGSAEATTLAVRSVQMVTSAQAFHWFDKPRARSEFERILIHGGWVVLLWNQRLTDTPFLQAYEALLKEFSKEYPFVGYQNVDLAELKSFFSPGTYERHEFENYQDLDFEGLKGRLLSASYIPNVEDPQYPYMMADLSDAFERHSREGIVRLSYHTQVFSGRFVA